MVGLIGLYVAGFFISIVVAGLVWDEGKKTLGARLGLATPVWPLTLVFGLYVLVIFLWNQADLETKKGKV